jgi:hypothetical protein
MTEGKVDSFRETEVFPGIESYYVKIDCSAQPVNSLQKVRRRAVRSGVIYEVNGCEALADKRLKTGFRLTGPEVI